MGHVKSRFVQRAVVITAALAFLAAQANAASDSDKLLVLAKKWFYAFERMHIDRSQLDPQVKRQLTDDLVRRVSARLRSFGKPTSWEYLGSEPVSYATGYDFLMSFAHGRVVESIALDEDGEIGGVDFRTFVER